MISDLKPYEINRNSLDTLLHGLLRLLFILISKFSEILSQKPFKEKLVKEIGNNCLLKITSSNEC